MGNSFKLTLGTGTRCAAAALSLLALTGCNQLDPLTRPYMWHPTEVNAQNIAAMAANPNDLNRGRDTPRRRVHMEAAGVERLWNGQTLPLLVGAGGSGGSSGSGGGSGGASGGGGTPPAGGGT